MAWTFGAKGSRVAKLRQHRLLVLTPHNMLDLLRPGFVTLGAHVVSGENEAASQILGTPSSAGNELPAGPGRGAARSSKATVVVALMIFDECHHATKNGPINCIKREFYMPFLRNQAESRVTTD